MYNINTKIKSTRIFSNAFCLTPIQKCFSTHRPKSELEEYPRYLYPALLSYHKFRQRQLVIPPFKSSIYFVYLKSVYFYSAFQSYFCWMDYKKLLYSIYGCFHNGPSTEGLWLSDYIETLYMGIPWKGGLSHEYYRLHSSCKFRLNLL